MTTIGPFDQPAPRQPRPRSGSSRNAIVASYLVGVAGLASVVTVLYCVMQAVLGSGGVRGTGGSVAYVIVGGLFFSVLAARGAFLLRAPGVVLLSWPIASLAVAVNFLRYGVNPPGAASVSTGWIFSGILFALLGLVPIAAMIWLRRAVRDAQRNLVTVLRQQATRARGGPGAAPGVRVVDADVIDPGDPPAPPPPRSAT